MLIEGRSDAPVRKIAVKGAGQGLVSCTLRESKEIGNSLSAVFDLKLEKEMPEPQAPFHDQLMLLVDEQETVIDVFGVYKSDKDGIQEQIKP
jgi:hypothetical protein